MTVREYLEKIPEDRQSAFAKLRGIIKKNLPGGFEERMNYGMIGYVVPHSLYPSGYHCDPKLPLPFAGIASQKAGITLYHMGLYGDEELKIWFAAACRKEFDRKLDVGKGCVRFKRIDEIPYGAIGALMKKLTPKKWIRIYEETIRK